jgi:hypothetical protein
VGRKAVVLPDFLKGEEASRFLSHLTTVTLARGYTHPGEALYVEGLQHPKLGQLHLVFRNRRATTADLGQAGDELLLHAGEKYGPSISRNGLWCLAHGRILLCHKPIWMRLTKPSCRNLRNSGTPDSGGTANPRPV